MSTSPQPRSEVLGRVVGRVQVAPAHELAAEEIRRAIALGRYSAGDRLPNERELSQQLGVARATLREATRSLVADGLLDVRRGAHGGIRVAERVTHDKRELRRSLRRIVGEVDDILDLRVALESGAARFAALRRTPEDLVALQDAFDRMQRIFDEGRMEAVSEFWRADIEFHTVLAAAARSGRLREAVEQARVEFLRPVGHVLSTIHVHAHDGHLAILQAVRAGQADAAVVAARDHIEVTRATFHEIAQVRPDGPRAR